MNFIKDYIGKGINDLEAELISLIKQYNLIKPDTQLFIFSSAIGKPIPDISMNMDDYYMFFDFLRDPKKENIDIYIETPGGSGEAAEEIGRFLHNTYQKVTFLVSGEAKSAGTMLVLSGNEIKMSKSGSLGPIDAQMQIGRTRISAYDYEEWVNDKRIEAQRVGKLNPFDAIMIAQISPGEIMSVHHNLCFAQDIVTLWLAKYKFKNWITTETKKVPVTDEMRAKRAKEIADTLIDHSKWRSHGRSIKIEDLEAIGLKIVKLDDEKDIIEIVYRIQTVLRFIYLNSNTYKCYATESQKVFKRAISSQDTDKNLQKQIKEIKAIDFKVKCQKCGKEQHFFGKFTVEKILDDNFIKNGIIPIPKSKSFTCTCGFTTDLNPIINELEIKFNKKIII